MQPQKFKQTLVGQIPQEWKVETLAKVSEKLVVGFVGTCDPFYTDNRGVPMIRTTNVKEGHLDLSDMKYVTRHFHEKNKKSQLKENDLVVARHGESGQACLIRGLKDANCLSVVIIRPDPSVWLPEYFEFAFNSPMVRKQISRRTGGGVQTVVNTSEVAKVSIPIPDKNEQEKIASILSKVGELIQKTNQIIEQTQRLREGLMQKLLTRGIGHHEYKPVRFGSLFLEFNIPDKWEVRTLEHCVRGDVPITYGIVQAGPNVPSGIPYIRTGDMSGGRLSKDGMLHTSVKIASSFPRSRVKAGEIVCALRGIVGKVLEVPEELEGANYLLDMTFTNDTYSGHCEVNMPENNLRSFPKEQL